MLRKTKKKRRRYPGENQAYLLVRWLNQGSDAATSRVTTLIDTGKALIGLRHLREWPVASLNPYKPGVIGSKTAFANSRSAAKLVRTINTLLAKFRMFPQYGRGFESSWIVSWVAERNRTRLHIRVRAGSNDDDIPFGESDAVSSLLRLVEQGHLARVRKCACGKWFYAKFIHQKFCAMPCQQGHFRRTDEFRAHRREYMRTHRALLAKRSGRSFKPRRARS